MAVGGWLGHRSARHMEAWCLEGNDGGKKARPQREGESVEKAAARGSGRRLRWERMKSDRVRRGMPRYIPRVYQTRLVFVGSVQILQIPFS